jgi:hypothetical protein
MNNEMFHEKRQKKLLRCRHEIRSKTKHFAFLSTLLRNKIYVKMSSRKECQVSSYFKGIFEDNIENNFCIFSLLGGWQAPPPPIP